MPKRPRKCPVCGNAPTTEFEPFCCRGCKDRDLLKWLGDGYRAPGPAVDPESIAHAQNGVDSDC